MRKITFKNGSTLKVNQGIIDILFGTQKTVQANNQFETFNTGIDTPIYLVINMNEILFVE